MNPHKMRHLMFSKISNFLPTYANAHTSVEKTFSMLDSREISGHLVSFWVIPEDPQSSAAEVQFKLLRFKFRRIQSILNLVLNFVTQQFSLQITGLTEV